MNDVDQISALLATLEMVSAENMELLEHFKDLREKLEALEYLAPNIRRAEFRQLEKSGAMDYKGVDIRHFASTKKSLPPPQFMERSIRRLRNTSTLVEKFLEYKDFAGGVDLQYSLQEMTNEIIDINNMEAVRNYKQRLETFRDSDRFQSYLKIKVDFIRDSPDLRDEVDIISAREVVEDGEMFVANRQQKIEDIQTGLDNGTLPLDEAQEQLDVLQDLETFDQQNPM